MAQNKKVTSNEVASLASKVLKDNNASRIAKELAGSVLSQKNKVNQTGSEMEEKASNVLKSDKYSEETKTLAASLVSQSNKDR